MTGFEMPTGASTGYVLTSDATGQGSWQAGGTADDGDWTVSGYDIYANAAHVGIGTTTPNEALVVQGVIATNGFRLSDGEEEGYVLTCGPEPDNYASWQPDGLTLPYMESVSSSNAAIWVSNSYGAPGSSGLYGHSVGGDGVVGLSNSGNGVSGSGPVGVYGTSNGGEAIRGRCPSGGTAVYGYTAYGHAGYFNGNVTITGLISKGGGSFRIDHPLDPENKYLSHSFVESPDMMNVYNGNVVVDAAGEAWIDLPEWFEALNKEFRYQLTAIGAPGPNLYVATEISDNRFKIAGGEAGMKVSWQVTGIRHDAFAEANPIVVEEEKPDDERGTYLHPEAHGKPKSMGVDYERASGMEK